MTASLLKSPGPFSVILTVANNVVIWMVSTRLPTFKFTSLINNPLVTVPKAPIMIGITVTFMFHNFFNSLARSKYLSFFSLPFCFILWSAGTANYTIWLVLFFFVVDYFKVLVSFSLQHLLMIFLSSLNDSKPPQVSRTLPSILTDLNNAVIWIVSNLPPPSISAPPALLPILGGLFQVHHLQLVSPSPSGSIAFLFSGKV